MISELLLLSMVHAQTLKKNLYQRDVSTVPAEVRVDPPKIKVTPKIQKKASTVEGNLPRELLSGSKSREYDENPVILPSKPPEETIPGIRQGDTLLVEIPGSLIVFPDAKYAVRGMVTSSKHRGAILLGEVSLERNTKRAMITFKSLRLSNSDQVFDFRGDVFGDGNQPGIAGEYHSGELEYFAAESLAAFAAGFSDSMVDRSTSAFGQVIETPSLANSGRRALSGSLSRTADRFAEKIKTAPEYLIVQGPLSVQVVIHEKPKKQQ